MKVVQVVPRLTSGGVERGVVEIALALQSSGHKAVVISEGGSLCNVLKQHDVEHVFMPVARKSPTSLVSVFKLARWFEKHRPDIVHPRSRLPAWLCWLALQSIGQQERPAFVTSVHGLHSVNRYSKVVTFGDLVEVVSNTACQYTLSSYGGVDRAKIRVIRRGIDPERYYPGFRPEQRWIDAHWRSMKRMDQPTIVLPGRLARLKGHSFLFEIVSCLDSAGVCVNALIVGGPEPGREQYASHLQKTIDSSELLTASVQLVGHRNDLREIMAMSDVVLSLSTTPESFGRTVLESLSLGTPVVGFDHGGVGEILGEIFAHGAVPVGDVTATSECIRKLLKNPKEIRTHHMTQQAMEQATLRMYEELLS